MGDWGKNGAKRKLTVRNGEGWASLAQRAGLNQRQLEDLMRANPNILQLKAGQTINTGGIQRNDNAYVSNYTAAASGMQTSGQLQASYGAGGNATGGVNSPKLQNNQPIYGGNFGYNLSTSRGRSQLAWQNNPNNPGGVYAGNVAPATSNVAPGATSTPQAGSAASGLAPFGYGNNQAPARPAMQATPQAGSAASGLAPLGYGNNQPTRPVSTPTTPSGLAPLGYGNNQPQRPAPQPTYATGGGTQGVMPSINGVGQQSTPATQTPPAPPNPVAPGQTYNAGTPYADRYANTQYTQNKNIVDAIAIDNLLSPGGVNVPRITADQITGLKSLYPSRSMEEISGALYGLGYQQDVAGNYFIPGNMSLNGGPDLSVPSGYGDFAGLPAYQGPPPSYDEPVYRGGGGRGRGGSGQQQPVVQSGTETARWRIGG